MLARLAAMGIGRAILSNGEPGMLAEAVAAAGIDRLLDDVLSVESVGVFKPDPRVYRLAADCFGAAAGTMAFVSSNPWDAFGARELRLPGVLGEPRPRSPTNTACRGRRPS